MKLDRRNFLQQAGLALFTLGVAEAESFSWGNSNRLTTLVKNYRQTLAEPTSRKLALLVGINRYPHNDNLNGCLTDVELQRELLINRFGFKPQDIVTLSDRQATRENIETAFIEHLVKQAGANDVVLFHFSGYGRQIKMPLASEVITGNGNESEAFKLVNSYVPVDGVFPSKKASVANNILQDTLLGLAQSLSTPKCTFVLDTSFHTTPRSKHGSFKIRSTPEIAETLSSQELIFLEQLRNNFAAKRLKPSKRFLSLPGVVLSATSNNQIAAERRWDNFSAGLFTHALTQHLWQITPSSKMQVALGRTAATVEKVMGKQQQPSLNNPDKSAIAYYLATVDAPHATGVVSKVNGNNNVEVKLLGLSATLLECYGVHSCFGLISGDRSLDSPLLQIQGQEGLVGKAKLHSQKPVALKKGQLVVERIRMLERNLGLTLALDADLQRIERVDATSALANISGVNSAVVSKEQDADCLLGKVDHLLSDNQENSTSLGNTGSSYGLYTAGGVLIGKTTGLEDEAVKIAIDRLQPQFKNILAAKWLELTNNEFTSNLKIAANLTINASEQLANLERSTLAFAEQQHVDNKSLSANNRYKSNPANVVPTLVKGSQLKLSLASNHEHALYAMVFGIDSDSNIFAVYTPAESKSTEAEVQLKNLEIPSQGFLSVPQSENSWKWEAANATGINVIYTIFSTEPLTQTLKTLAEPQNFQLDRMQVLNVVNPVDVVKALMEDLHAASSVNSELLPNHEVYALDVDRWATLSFVYEIVNG